MLLEVSFSSICFCVGDDVLKAFLTEEGRSISAVCRGLDDG